jgi:hypothetical protein
MITIDTRKYPIDSIFGQCNLQGIHVQKDGQFFVFSNASNTLRLSRQLNYNQITEKLTAAFKIEFI